MSMWWRVFLLTAGLESIIFKDYPMVLAVLLLSVVGVVVLNFLAELCANLLDTRKVYA